MKPGKPYPEFPLFPHATKRWAKKIRGKMHYFGHWDDPQAALDKYLQQKDDLHAGRTPRVQGDGLTVKDLANRFLTSKQAQLDAGELAKRSFDDYYRTCANVINAFGGTRLVDDLAADDFERFRAALAKRLGPVPLGNEIQRVRVLFKYASDNKLIDAPMHYGQGFKKPSKKTLRLHRAAGGERLFTPRQIHDLLKVATVPMQAMILLGINCGFGNSDCGRLPLSAVDAKSGWLDYHRPKTGIARRCPLWPETVKAIAAYLKKRHEHKDGADILFVTKFGASWAKDGMDNPISKEMAKLEDAIGIEAGRRLGFYALRHTFETIGGESCDQVAVNHIMGHADASMAAVYRERISDERLLAVTDHVHRWLFGK